MVLRNHIAYRFLTDETLIDEMLEGTYPEEYRLLLRNKDLEIPEKILSFYNSISNTNQKAYVVTESVIQNLDLLKVKKRDNHFDWTYFKNLKDQKVTFIMPNNICIRMLIQNEIMYFIYLVFDMSNKNTGKGHLDWIMFYLDRYTGQLCEHFEHKDVKDIEENIYKFLCFFYLSENQEEIIPPGRVYGTRKTGKVLNDFKFPVTLVTKKWNVTSIRTEGFAVYRYT